jgi:hypothetical protein
MAGRLSASLLSVTVHRNGRPKAAPRAMDVALVARLVNPVTGQLLASRAFELRASTGETLGAGRLVAGLEPGQGAPLFEKPVPLPDVAVLDLRFTVFYQNDLGPIVGAAINKVVDLAAGRVPFVGELLGPRLHVKIGERISEEYGRQSLLLNAASTVEPARAVALELAAAEAVRGVYLVDATGRAPARVSPPTVFIEAGESAATVVLVVGVEPAPPAKKGKARAAKRSARP